MLNNAFLRLYGHPPALGLTLAFAPQADAVNGDKIGFITWGTENVIRIIKDVRHGNAMAPDTKTLHKTLSNMVCNEYLSPFQSRHYARVKEQAKQQQ